MAEKKSVLKSLLNFGQRVHQASEKKRDQEKKAKTAKQAKKAKRY